MIAKHVPRKQATSSFARLARYVLAAKGQEDPDTWKRDGEGELVFGAKVDAVRVTNCVDDDPAAAVVGIEAAQKLNTRSKADKTYHLVVSFPPGERPDTKTLHEIEDALVEAIGLATHQRLSVIHDDTDHLHMHVAINKVNPVTHRNVTPAWDKAKLMQACTELEQRYGLQVTNHGETLQPERPTGRAGDMEAHAGRESLMGWVKRDVAPKLAAAESWPQLHKALAEHGLQLKERGNGFVIEDAGGVTIRASSLGRGYSKAALEKRLGAFQKPAGRVVPLRRYAPTPKHQHASTGALYKRYQELQERLRLTKIQERERLRVENERWRKEQQADYAAKRAAIKDSQRAMRTAGAIGKAEKRRRSMTDKAVAAVLRSRYTALAAQRRAEAKKRKQLEADRRRAVEKSTAIPGWQQWLTQQAQQGDPAAVAVLRSRESAKQTFAAQWIKADTPAKALGLLAPRANPKVRKSGDVAYRVPDGGRCTDARGGVRVDKASDAATFLALSVAAEKYAGQALIVEGSKAFQEHVARVAAEKGMAIRFADPLMEKMRAAELEKRQPKERGGAGTAAAPATPAKGKTTAAGVAQYVEERNKKRESITSICYHREWKPDDAGAGIYQGRRRFDDGTEAVLVQKGEAVLVKPVTAAQAAKAAGFTVGQAVNIDKQGRIVTPEQKQQKDKGRGR